VIVYSALSDRTPQSIVDQFAGKGFGAFKPALADLAIATLGPIRQRLTELLEDRETVAKALADGAEKANALAAPTLLAAKQAVGLQV
jgi:tryptophanyl-tRNA synthetase